MTIVGVGGRDDLDDMAEFIDRYGVGAFDHVADESGEVWSAYGVTSQPAFVFIDGETGTSETLISRLGVDGLTERIEALL